MGDVTDRVLRVLQDKDTGTRVEAYFAAPAVSGVTYTGRLFEQFGGGGDRSETADRFVADDLLAVEALSVRVPPDAAHEILYGAVASELAELLVDVPRHVELGSPAAAAHVEDSSPASRAWKLLDDQPGIGWVTAGKLMARKRPVLIPVYDEVVRCILGHPARAWCTLDEVLADADVQRALRGLRDRTPVAVTRLRTLDVAMWMFHHDDHRHGRCEQFGPLS